MPARLLLAPAASGKTQFVLEQVQAALRAAPLTPVWIILPDRTQAAAFRRRLAEPGGALGAQVSTFGDLYAEILAQAGQQIPQAPEPVIHRLLRAAVDSLAGRGLLLHYAPIQRRPGFVRALDRLIAELKRLRVEPPSFLDAVRDGPLRLQELALIYAEYQTQLQRLNWADAEGLGWLAVRALETRPDIARGWSLVAVDGFDSPNRTQLETLRIVFDRAHSALITLTGEPGMPRAAHRRFARTLENIQRALRPEVIRLPVPAPRAPVLAHLERWLFESGAPALEAGPQVSFVEAQTPALEARAALRWLKARIVRDGVPLDACLVTALDLKPYQPFLREAAREFGLPVRFAEGEALRLNPAVAAFLEALSLPMGGWARRPVLDTMRAPYFDLSPFGLDRAAADRADEAARWGRVIAGIDQWAETLARLAALPADAAEVDEDAVAAPPGLPRGPQAAELWRRMQSLFHRLTPPARARMADYLGWVEDLLDEGGGLGLAARLAQPGDSLRRDQAALAALREILRALFLSESILASTTELDYADFYGELRGAVEAAAYQPEAGLPRAGRVYLASLNAARGVPFRAVVVLGLAEGLFPAPLVEDPFLPDAEREELRRRGLPLEPRLRSDQQTLFYEAVTRAAGFLLLTRPYLASDGERWEASPYWQAARELFHARPERVRPERPSAPAEAASTPEALAALLVSDSLPGSFAALRPRLEMLEKLVEVLRARQAREPLGPHEGQPRALAPRLAGRYGPGYIWSASGLESYGACGFQFFVSRALGLEERQPPAPGFDAAQRGSLLHALLEAVYRRAADPTSADSLQQALREAAPGILTGAPETYGFRPTPLWAAQQQEILELLERNLAALAAQADDFRPAHFEARFGFGAPPLVMNTDQGPVRFRGVIDRVDMDPDGNLRVIDYKSGASGLGPRELVEGRRLQLAIYALAAESALGLGRAVSGLYWAISQAKAGGLRLQDFEHVPEAGSPYRGMEGAARLVREHVTRLVQGIRQAEFSPNPPAQGCPVYCPARLFCWRYSPTAYR